MNKTMKLEDIELFVHVADHMSFTGAAKELDLPQPSISRKIKQLEDELKVRLFERASRKISLTEQGAQYYKHCEVILLVGSKESFHLAKPQLQRSRMCGYQLL